MKKSSYIIDTNFFRRLTQTPSDDKKTKKEFVRKQFLEAFDECCYSDADFVPKASFIIEAVGITNVDLDDIAPLPTDDKLNYHEKLSYYMEKFWENKKEEEKLYHLIEKRHKKIAGYLGLQNPLAKELFHKCVSKFIDIEFKDIFLKEIIEDRYLSLKPCNKDSKENFDEIVNLICNIQDPLSKRMSKDELYIKSLYRAASNLIENFYNLQENTGGKITNNFRVLHSKSLQNPQKDFFDSQIIHLLTFGEKTKDRINSCHLFTEEIEERIDARIELYFMVLNFLRNKLSNEQNINLALEPSLNNLGSVSFFDAQTGNFMNNINTSKFIKTLPRKTALKD